MRPTAGQHAAGAGDREGRKKKHPLSTTTRDLTRDYRLLTKAIQGLTEGAEEPLALQLRKRTPVGFVGCVSWSFCLFWLFHSEVACLLYLPMGSGGHSRGCVGMPHLCGPLLDERERGIPTRITDVTHVTKPRAERRG